METYKEFLHRQQEEVNALPMYWAFSDEQFNELLKQLGLTDSNYAENLVRYQGAIVRKKDVPIIKATLERLADELDEALKDIGFFKEAALYEMCNHEYGINWQADWDVINALGFDVRYSDGNELEECKMSPEQKRAYCEARREYYKLAEEKEWF